MDEELGISVIFFWGKLLSAFQPKNSPNFWYHKKKTLGLAKLGKNPNLIGVKTYIMYMLLLFLFNVPIVLAHYFDLIGEV
jgi:hypothetical protein